MLRCGNSIRLTGPELAGLAKIAGVYPEKINSLNDLRRFINRRLRVYCGPSPEERLLRALLIEELNRYRDPGGRVPAPQCVEKDHS